MCRESEWPALGASIPTGMGLALIWFIWFDIFLLYHLFSHALLLGSAFALGFRAFRDFASLVSLGSPRLLTPHRASSLLQKTYKFLETSIHIKLYELIQNLKQQSKTLTFYLQETVLLHFHLNLSD
jgi:hypothetical protein